MENFQFQIIEMKRSTSFDSKTTRGADGQDRPQSIILSILFYKVLYFWSLFILPQNMQYQNNHNRDSTNHKTSFHRSLFSAFNFCLFYLLSTNRKAFFCQSFVHHQCELNISTFATILKQPLVVIKDKGHCID